MKNEFALSDGLDNLTLDQIIDAAWRLLTVGADAPGDPFHTPVLSTIGSVFPESRVVVLRKADSQNALLECHTDLRSSKVEQMSRSAPVSWTFYNADEKIQVRARGRAEVHTDDDYAQSCWEAISDRNKRCYAQKIAAGEVVDEIVDAAPCPKISDVEVGRKNFAVIRCQVSEIEWLYLHRSGHQRALCTAVDSSWTSQWIMP